MAIDPQVEIRAFRDLTERALRSAAARSLNRAATTVRQEATTRIRETLNLKSSDVKNAIQIDKASAREDLLTMKATLIPDRHGIPLVAFSPREKTIKTKDGKKTGVTVKVKTERKLVVGAFLATMPNGHVGIFKRRGKSRLPIKEAFSTSVADIFKNKDFLDSLKAFSRQVFEQNFTRELKYQLSKKG